MHSQHHSLHPSYLLHFSIQPRAHHTPLATLLATPRTPPTPHTLPYYPGTTLTLLSHSVYSILCTRILATALSHSNYTSLHLHIQPTTTKLLVKNFFRCTGIHLYCVCLWFVCMVCSQVWRKLNAIALKNTWWC